ncbi:MAG: C40 family peptidase [Muribaculaceae bacterium]|nr:C40 family peptidase [Muribaculaceae bacterium]
MRKILTLLLVALVAIAATAGDDINQVLNDLKSRVAPDGRVAIWKINVVDSTEIPIVQGTVGYTYQKEEITDELNMFNIRHINEVKVLADEIPASKQWAIVKLSIATLRCDPKHSAEIATQCLMGTPLRVIELVDDWLRVQCPDDYIAYVPESSVRFLTQMDFNSWQRTERYIVTVYDDQLVTKPKGDETVSDLVLGDILQFVSKKGKWIELSTPDGRTGWVNKSSVEQFDKWVQQPIDLNKIEKTARRMMGSSYLWGGTSTKVTDCSGLAKVSYFSNGIILQRDASQQALTGLKIADWHDAQLCDLLFFGNSKTGRVTHVGLYLRDGKYIHCSGQVKINDLDPDAPDYLYSPLSISRINGMVGTKGIKYVRDHNWYFNK